jgi:hypothetical protein
MSHVCKLCQKPHAKAIFLRTEEYVCQKCINARENLVKIYLGRVSELQKIKPPINIWDVLKVLVVIFSIGLGLCITYLLSKLIDDYYFIAFFITVFFGIHLSGYFEKASIRKRKPHEDLKKQKIEDMQNNIVIIQQVLQDIYKEYWDLPPDWQWRREEVMERDLCCQDCGRQMGNFRTGYKSKVPFHVHHKIPKSNSGGNHSLDNLILLCEICHAKQDGYGHESIKYFRKKRLKTKKVSRNY